MPPDGPPPTLIDHPTLIAHGSMQRVVDLALTAATAPAAVPDLGATVPPAATRTEDLVVGASTGSELDILDLLGKGGLNLVYRARHRGLEREVAVKRVRPDQDRPEVRQLLLREARVTGSLEHPGVVPIHDLR